MALIPGKRDVKKNISKAAVIDHLVGAWQVLQHVTNHASVELDVHTSNALDAYIVLMEWTVSSCQSALEAEQTANCSGESLKLSQTEANRGYLEGGAFVPGLDHHNYPVCHAPYMHEPPENKKKRKRTKKIRNKWKSDGKKVAKYLDNEGPPLLDDKGKIIKKLPPPKEEHEILACKANKMTHSQAVDGYKCTDCIDCSCELCQNKCTFVCTKK